MRARLPAIVLAFAVAATARAGEPWPELPAPPRAQLQWIGDSMRINGIPTRVARFESSISKQEMVEFFRAHWAGGRERPAPSISEVDGATVIGQAHGPYWLTAKVRTRGRDASEGLLSVARVMGEQTRLDPGEVMLMPNAQVLSVVESDDPGRRSRYVVIAADTGADGARAFYEAALRQRGWVLLQQGGPAPAAAAAGAARGHFAIWQRESARERNELHLSVLASPSGRGGSMVIANLVTQLASPGDAR